MVDKRLVTSLAGERGASAYEGVLKSVEGSIDLEETENQEIPDLLSPTTLGYLLQCCLNIHHRAACLSKHFHRNFNFCLPDHSLALPLSC